MTETKPINWQIRINIFGTTEEAYAVHDTIANAMGRERFNDIRLINIDKGEGEVDDETQIFCKACGKLDGNLFDHVCDACLLKEKEEQQREEDAKYDEDKYEIEWGWVVFCNHCNRPAKYVNNNSWCCIHDDRPNAAAELDSFNATKFHAERITKDELIRWQKKYPHAEWD